MVAARTVPGQRHGLGLFLVEDGMAGFRRGRNLKKMGLKAQDTSELFFQDLRVPKSHVLGDPAQGFRYLTRFLAEERLINAVWNMAHAQHGFDVTLDFVKERQAFGRPVGTFQNSRFRLAELRAQLDCTQAFLDHCVALHLEDHLTAEIGAEIKLLSSELEGRVMDEGVQLHGGAGDRAAPGPDHAFSADPSQWAEMALRIRLAETLRGSGTIEPSEASGAMVVTARRSIVAARAIERDEVIEPEMLAYKRPGDGLPPGYADLIIGNRATRALAADEQFREGDCL